MVQTRRPKAESETKARELEAESQAMHKSERRVIPQSHARANELKAVKAELQELKAGTEAAKAQLQDHKAQVEAALAQLRRA